MNATNLPVSLTSEVNLLETHTCSYFKKKNEEK
jgi:hypothetical protein